MGSDIPRDQHRRLHPLPDASGAFALIPDPIPKVIPEDWTVQEVMTLTGTAAYVEQRIARLAAALKALPNPETAISAILLQRLDRCSAPAANEALKAAVAVGMVEQITRGERNRLFAAR